MLVPRWYQTEAVDAAWSHLCDHAGNPVIVLPTGSGKTICIAMLCQKAIDHSGRVIVLAHRKELLQQDAEKIQRAGFDVGLYSAGLDSRDTDHDIVVAGIQSIFRRASELGSRQLVIIDEVHLVAEEGMYQTFLADLRLINPKLRIVGLTATPFRTGTGTICRADALFQRVCYSAPLRRLIDEGYLSALTTTAADATVDTSGLHIRGGEFIPNEVSLLFDDSAKINAACREIIAKTADRRSTLVFCSGVFHTQNVQAVLEKLSGEECGLVTGDTPPLERAAALRRFRDGSLKRLTNCEVLTTGFDSPGIDAIAILRATMSPGLFAQMVGRGLRRAPEKESCLVLDFGANIKRHGPLDAEDYGARSGRQTLGDNEAPVKTCPNCEETCSLSARECACGFRFPEPELKHDTNASGDSILSGPVVPTEWIVESVAMSRHRKKGGTPDNPDTLRVDYTCVPADGSKAEETCLKCGADGKAEFVKMPEGHPQFALMRCESCKTKLRWVERGGNLSEKIISEWVCLEHANFARAKALLWWKKRSLAPVDSIDEAISLFQRGAVATPTRIVTVPDGKYTRIKSYELDEPPEEWSEAEVTVGWDVEALDEVPF